MPRCPACHRRLAKNSACPRDGQTAPLGREIAPEVPEELPQIAGYELGDPLGDGGYARVWAARRQADAATVAIKVGHSDVHATVARFQRESEILKTVGPPFAPQWYENGLVSGKPYIVMELIAGETLAQQLVRQDLLPNPTWVHTQAERIAKALDALHSRSLVHRDLKPENVIIAPDESRLVLLDFGLAKKSTSRESNFRDTRVTRAGMAIGTPEYMAPEAVRGADDVDARADVYAFGVLLYELFTLRVPFVGSGAMIEHGHVSLRPPRPSDFAPVPPLWEQLILACLAKDPARRPANAHILMRAIREIVDVSPLLQSMTTRRSEPMPAVSAPKLLSEGRHPTVLLYAEVPGPAALICNRIKASRGHVVRQRGAQYTAIFSGFDTDDPASAAVSAAKEIVQKDGRVALHLAPVTIRRKDRGSPMVYGAPVERPESWLPSTPWAGLVLTDEIQSVLSTESLSGPASAGPKSLRPSLRPVDLADNAPSDAFRPDQHPSTSGEFDRVLMGREESTNIIESAIRAAFTHRVPRLATLIGDAGLGKTRLAEHAIEYCKSKFTDACVVFTTAEPPGAGDGMRETASLLRQLLEAPEAAPADVNAYFAQTLGEDFRGAPARAVGALLGWNAAEPGDQAMHRTRAIAQAIRRRARTQSVAVILDDAHRADDALLDALEYVTLDGENLPVWVLITASPTFDEQRRSWGRRTRHFDRLVIAPLSDVSAKELAARLLHPAEYPPAAVLERLATWAGGNPFCLREVVRALKRLGIVKKREHGGSHYVATAELSVLPPIPAWQWLAVRQLDQMPLELAAYVRLCSVLGVSFTREEMDHVMDALDRTGKAGSPLDSDVALGVLVSRGILQKHEGNRYSFQNGVLGGAIYDLLDPAQRQEVHRLAFDLWNEIVDASHEPNPDALERLGRHSAALGERKAAAHAFLALGGLSRENHKDIEADRYYSAALTHALDDDKSCRAHAYLGRGRSRYRVSRVKEAIEDFRRANQVAEELGDRRMKAEVLLEQATAFDWSRQFSTSIEMVALAEPLIEELGEQDLRVRLWVAQGRAAFRAGKASESVELFNKARTAAKEAGDYDALVITLLLLASQLAVAGRLDEAEARFDECVSMVEAANDRPHLCSALGNRVALWHGRRALDKATVDLQRAIEIAREIGNPWLERLAAHNIATLLLWTGERIQAVEFGRRAQLLTERFFEPAFITSSLLYARILLATEAFEEAARLYAWINQNYNPDNAPSARARWNYPLIGLVLDVFAGEGRERSIEAWDSVMNLAAGEGDPQVTLEILYWRIRTALRAEALDDAHQAMGLAKQKLADCSLWPNDFNVLEQTLDSLRQETDARVKREVAF